jgi:PKD repeat protein
MTNKAFIQLWVFLFITHVAIAQNKINQYTYWFDNDYANKTIGNITPVADYNLNTSVATTSLNEGLHIIHVQFRDDSLRYSSVISHFFLKTNNISSPNNKIAAYEYWFDNNYGSKVYQSVTAVQSLNLNTAIATSSLNSGLHAVHFRAKDSNGKWSNAVSSFFMKAVTPAVNANNKISRYEYWYNNNYAQKVSVSPTANQNFQVIAALSTTTLNEGLNTIHIRFRDNAQNWSSVVSQFFYKLPAASAVANKIKTYEYWFDNNYNQKVSTNVSAQQNVQVVSQINTNTLSPGLHTFHFRAKDQTNKWSVVTSSFFVKPNIQEDLNNTIAGYEYWFDNNYNAKTSVGSINAAVYTHAQAIPASSIEEGLHIFHIRYKDKNGRWSAPASQFIYKTKAESLSGNLISAYRYWFDKADSAMVYTELNSPVSPYNLVTQIDMKQIRKGIHVIHFQFKDTHNQWSSVTTDSIAKITLPVASFSAAQTVLCDTGTVTFSNTSIDGDTYLWSFGDGGSSEDSTGVHKYTTPGLYAVTLNVTDTTDHVDSALTITNYVHVVGSPQVYLGNDTAICEQSTLVLNAGSPNLTYIWQDNSTPNTYTVTAQGTYSVHVSDSYGCEGSDDIQVSINPLPVVNLGNDVSICSGNQIVLDAGNTGANYLWSTGATTQIIQANTSNQYTVNVTNMYNCSENAEMNLLVHANPLVNVGVDTAICSGTTLTLNAGNSTNKYIWSTGATTNTIDVNLPNTYSVLATNSYSCTTRDVIVIDTLPLTIAKFSYNSNELNATLINQSLFADSYVWKFGDGNSSSTVNPSHNYSQNGTYTVFLKTTNTCGSDSITTIISIISSNILNIQLNELFDVYPNPTSGAFNLNLKSKENKSYNLMIYDMAGKMVLQKIIEASSNESIPLTISNEANGVYTIILVDESNQLSMVKRLILQH